MARPRKEGLDYFPLDVGFIEDIKVRKLLRKYDASSIAVLIYLLSFIYRDKGYYMEVDENIYFIIADTLKISESQVESIVQYLLEIDFFNKNMFELYGILTSKSIQVRYVKATERRMFSDIEEKFRLFDMNDVRKTY